ncbi:uncharacterized protein EDB93DRAFT_1223283 [Suillus bovinus]|uniref:uncharacterized protein n=1 Tax=Suillus bovinus TaxID=48563 RepID=UPI001B868C92|nr:uncharacterized protein EDB93DRAFT_1223283 [Suillus bovinus]KAG2154442.1 hypothetical protein EDB93DRAFT_1223283 [Suillus bovinus]
MQEQMDDQESEIRQLVENAEKEQDGGSELRRDALTKLIEIAHSSNSQLKCYAANHIRYFFNDFPDLEEDAINVVYDLCEDQDSRVRIEGYRAISSVSFVQHKWVKRNSDVLVQLLQSDEPEEVVVVKAALCDHLDMDPGVTLGVLCDQIIPPEYTIDEEEQQIRDRLRSLVIAFLKVDAAEAIIRKYTKTPGTDTENVLVSQLLTAIRRLETRDVEVIIKDLLLMMPCYGPGSSRGMDLLHVLIDKARSSLNVKSNDLGSIKTIDFYISLAHFVAIQKRVASPVVLLRFYCTYLMGKPVLQRFSPEEQLVLAGRVVEALEACEEESHLRPQICSHEQFSFLRRQVVDGAPNLLEAGRPRISKALYDTKLESSTMWDTLSHLLLACKHRKEREDWVVPFNLATSISKFQAQAQQLGPGNNSDEIRVLIRVRSGPLSAFSQSLTETSMSQASSSTSVDGEGFYERPAHLPARPQVGRPLLKRPDMSRLSHTSTSGAASNSRPASHTRDSGSVTLPKRSLSSGETVPQIKRVKTELTEERQLTPSLLSRMMMPIPGDAEKALRKRGGAGRKRVDDSSEPDKHPMSGYSIKGAAAHAERGEESRDLTPRTSSLLDRLNKSEGADGGNRKRYRGKA